MVTIVRLLPKWCSCMTLLGSRQREYEENLAQLLPPSPTTTQVAAAITEAINRMGWFKMCCRAQVCSVPIYFIRDADKDAFTDETGLTANTNIYDISKRITQNGKPVIPRRTPPPFPPLPGAETPMSPRRLEAKLEPVAAPVQPQGAPFQLVPAAKVVVAAGKAPVRLLPGAQIEAIPGLGPARPSGPPSAPPFVLGRGIPQVPPPSGLGLQAGIQPKPPAKAGAIKIATRKK